MKSIQESGEMYLETILILSKEKSMVRSIDVSEYMNYSKPSVSRAVSLLKDGGYLTVESDGALVLTDEGRRVAENILERHETLSRVLVGLGVSESIAVEDACRIEHVISAESFEAIKKYLSQ